MINPTSFTSFIVKLKVFAFLFGHPKKTSCYVHIFIPSLDFSKTQRPRWIPVIKCMELLSNAHRTRRTWLAATFGPFGNGWQPPGVPDLGIVLVQYVLHIFLMQVLLKKYKQYIILQNILLLMNVKYVYIHNETNILKKTNGRVHIKCFQTYIYIYTALGIQRFPKSHS